VTAPGDLKFAAPPLPVDEAALTALRNRLAGRPIWLAASTHPGEETLVFAVHRQLAAAYPGLLTIVAPRHPERGARLAEEAGALTVARRGAGEGRPDEGIWLADTLGELGLWYRLRASSLSAAACCHRAAARTRWSRTAGLRHRRRSHTAIS